GHHRLSTYGILKSYDQRICENLVHQLLDQEYLSRSIGDRPVVMLNEKSWEILRNQREVILLEPRLKKSTGSRKESDDWNGVDRTLFDHLRQWRRKIADERGKPAWTILDDRALRSIAREKPTSSATLLNCKGIGEKRLADHGVALLEIIKQHHREFE
ncbi:MAG: DNA helicase RecQ, partial [Planctomycetaceae bacterium]|nr:DNA helicase RecQ [Planctomycetaceae bacterium]